MKYGWKPDCDCPACQDVRRAWMKWHASSLLVALIFATLITYLIWLSKVWR